jgi:hypothetical protein
MSEVNINRAHFICRRLDNAGHDGLDLVGHLDNHNIYRSDSWAISPADANLLLGGLIFFHEHKVGPATFGGQLEWWCFSRQKTERSGLTYRVILFISAIPECIGMHWEGSRAYEWGGVISSPDERMPFHRLTQS